MTDAELEVFALEQHQSFIRKIVDTGVVYGLESENGWATALSNHFDDVVIVPFWSESALAQKTAVEDWADYEPAMMDISEFMEGWLTGMHNDGHLVGTNWTDELMGIEKEPLELSLEIITALRAKGKRIKLEVYKDLDELETEIREIIREEKMGE